MIFSYHAVPAEEEMFFIGRPLFGCSFLYLPVSVPPVEDIHHVRQRAVLAVADDARAAGLDLVRRVFRRKADGRDLQHRDVVVVVTHAVNVLARNAEQGGEL